jgi:hypothetical protein
MTIQKENKKLLAVEVDFLRQSQEDRGKTTSQTTHA